MGMKKSKRAQKSSGHKSKKKLKKGILDKMKVREIKDAGAQLPVLVYSEAAFKTLMLCMKSTHAKTKEFMMVGSVDRHENIFNIKNLYLPPNKSCSGSYCESGDSYDKWFFETFKTIEEKKAIRCHLHSHVNMKAFPSGTDGKQIMELYGAVTDYYVQIIVNHEFKNYVAIYERGLIYEEVPQFIQIKDLLISFEDLKKSSVENGIADGEYIIKNGKIDFEDGVMYDIYSAEWEIKSNGLKYDHGEISMIPTADELKTINAEFDKKCLSSTPTYTYTGSAYPYGGGSFANPHYTKPGESLHQNNVVQPTATSTPDKEVNELYSPDERSAKELIDELKKRGIIS